MKRSTLITGANNVLTPITPESKTITIAVTGHRPPRLGGYERNFIAERTRDWLECWMTRAMERADALDKELRLLCGMAQGTDQIAAWTAVELGIEFDAYLPYDNMSHKWSARAKEEFSELLSMADTWVSTAPEYETISLDERMSRLTTEGRRLEYKEAVNHLQCHNEALVDNCDVLIGVYDERSNGKTYNCLKYARQHSTVPVVWHNPHSMRTRRLNR